MCCACGRHQCFAFLLARATSLRPRTPPCLSNPPGRPQTSIAQFVRNDTDTNLVMSPEPVDASLGASVVASRDQILPLALIDFDHPELVDLTCAELLERFTPNAANAIFEV